MKLAIIDLETTGRTPGLHHIWEIGVILRGGEEPDRERLWQVDAPLLTAEPDALRVSRYYERREPYLEFGGAIEFTTPDDPSKCMRTPVGDVAADLAGMLDGAFVVANNPVFDVPFLESFLKGHGQCWTRHYHAADIKSLVVGYLHGQSHAWAAANDLPAKPAEVPEPWSTRKLALAVGVDPATYDTHTALGDCRLNRAIWDAVTGGGDQ